MRILHTSDWHLGKYLEDYSRIGEQQDFIVELSQIVTQQKIDLIIIAGDIYDTINPSAEAEKLFYKSLKVLSDDGKRPICIIAGNHDSPERLMAVSPLATEFSVVIVGTPKHRVEPGVFEYFSIVEAGEGFVEMKIKDEAIVILTMPYPSERRLNEIIENEVEETQMQKSYSDKMAEIFERSSHRYREDSINIAVGHFYLLGGDTSKSERDIQLGGSLAVNSTALPKKAQYVAMGHLHRSQRIKSECNHTYYSGSPIQYSKSEASYAKSVFVVDVAASQEPIVEKVFLRNYKPIEIVKTNSVQEALEKLEKLKDENCWVYLEIRTDTIIPPSDIKLMRSIKKDIIEISPLLNSEEEEIDRELEENNEKTILEEFEDFYKENRMVEVTDELKELFMSLCKEEEGDAD